MGKGLRIDDLYEITLGKFREGDRFFEGQEELSSVIARALENPDLFYKAIGEALSPEERNYIKNLLPRCCDTCANGTCSIEQVDKPVTDCIGWENDRIVGEYKVLKLNRNKDNKE